jgi:hypothetical protein
VTADYGSGRPPQVLSLAALLLALLVAALVAGAGAVIAARTVGPAIRDSSTPDNLRAP